jgi:hypothetical protein
VTPTEDFRCDTLAKVKKLSSEISISMTVESGMLLPFMISTFPSDAARNKIIEHPTVIDLPLFIHIFV